MPQLSQSERKDGSGRSRTYDGHVPRARVTECFLGLDCHELVWDASRVRGDLQIGLQTEMEPPADVIARRAPTLDDLVVTAAAAQVTRPTTVAGFLAVNMSFGKPGILAVEVDSGTQGAHPSLGIAHKAMAGRKVPVRRNPEISGAGATGIRTMGSLANFAKGIHEVGEGVAFPPLIFAEVFAAAVDHFGEEDLEVRRAEFPGSVGRPEKRGKSYALESLGEKCFQCRPEGKVGGGYRDAGGDLHPMLPRQQRSDPLEDPVEAAPSVLEGTLPIMDLAGSVEAEGHGKTMFLEELRIPGREERSVCRPMATIDL